MHLLDGGLYVCLQAGIIDWLETWDPDVLILEANVRYLSNWLAIRWMHQRRRPVLGWGLGAPPPKGWLAGLTSGIRKRYLAQFDALIAYSSRGAQAYRDAGMPEDRVFTAINAVAPKPSQMPQRMDVVDRLARILFVGRLQARKRVDMLLQACAKLDPAPELWIVGEGPALPELKSIAGALYPQAHFFGSRTGGELKQLFQQADLFVLPGTGGLAVQEAMSFGLPVIVAQGDGTQYDLVTPENGWLIEPDRPEALRRALEEALRDPGRLPAMGKCSFEIVRRRANVEAMTEVFIDAMESVSKRA
jgi:glycosyltransferase involved in cell wall biosynthesis